MAKKKTESIRSQSKRSGQNTKTAPSAHQAPTKDALIQTAKALHQALSSGNIDQALHYLVFNPSDKERIKKAFGAGWEEDNENLNAAGIALLVDKGEFGPLKDLFTKTMKGSDELWVEKYTKRADVPLSECYGIKLGGAEVMAHWKDGRFRIFRFDDAGEKLVKKMKD